MIRAACLLLFACRLAMAWGDRGHQVIGDIAGRLVAPATKEKLSRILGQGGTLSRVSTWADEMKRTRDFENTWIAEWHYATYDRNGKRMEKPDVVWAIGKLERILAGKEAAYEAPRKNSRRARSVVIGKEKALKLLVHFVGDIHQPLHAGNDRDRGGNSCRLVFFGETEHEGRPWNLHSVWDFGLLDRMEISDSALVELLISRLDDAKRAEWTAAANPEDWGRESRTLAPELYPQLDPKHPVEDTRQPYCGRGKSLPLPRITSAYLLAHRPRLETQLLKAAVRLAHLLDRALAP